MKRLGLWFGVMALLCLPARMASAQGAPAAPAAQGANAHEEGDEENEAPAAPAAGAAVAPAAPGAAPAAPAAPGTAPAAPGTAPAAAPTHPAPAHAGPRVVRVNVTVKSIGNVKIAEGTYTLEGEIGFTCADRGPDCPTDIESDLGDITQGEPDVADDGTIYRSFRFVFNGDIDLKSYPFDDHDFGFTFQPKNANINEVVFEKDGDNPVNMDPNKLRVAGWKLDDEADFTIARESGGESGQHTTVSVDLNYRRYRLASFLKAFLSPIFSMIFLSVLLMLRPKSATTRLTTAGGNLTAVAAQHIGGINQIPPVGYLTQMDKFFYFAYATVLLHIIIAVSLIKLDEKKDEAGADRLYRVALYTMPVVAAAFISAIVSGVI